MTSRVPLVLVLPLKLLLVLPVDDVPASTLPSQRFRSVRKVLKRCTNWAASAAAPLLGVGAGVDACVGVGASVGMGARGFLAFAGLNGLPLLFVLLLLPLPRLLLLLLLLPLFSKCRMLAATCS